MDPIPIRLVWDVEFWCEICCVLVVYGKEIEIGQRNGSLHFRFEGERFIDFHWKCEFCTRNWGISAGRLDFIFKKVYFFTKNVYFLREMCIFLMKNVSFSRKISIFMKIVSLSRKISIFHENFAFFIHFLHFSRQTRIFSKKICISHEKLAFFTKTFTENVVLTKNLDFPRST